jgi:hypothetical protein
VGELGRAAGAHAFNIVVEIIVVLVTVGRCADHQRNRRQSDERRTAHRGRRGWVALLCVAAAQQQAHRRLPCQRVGPAGAKSIHVRTARYAYTSTRISRLENEK